MMANSIEILATILFVTAILHTFLVKKISHLAKKFPSGSVGENVFHLLSEVEIVFGFWAGIFVLLYSILASKAEAIAYLDRQNLTEPIFVFVIMVVASTKPLIEMAESLMKAASRVLPLDTASAFFLSCFILGPLLGSFITEPAAMTLTALLLVKNFFHQPISQKFKYAMLGLLLVSVSIGGTLTPYAAPPVVMVANKWGWDLAFMLEHFGWRAVIAVLLSTLFVFFRFRGELSKVKIKLDDNRQSSSPLWVKLCHLLFLWAIVVSSHHVNLFFGIFLFFLGFATATKEYQQSLKIKEALLVSFFLAGLVVLGTMQAWWLQDLLSRMKAIELYIGGIALTSVTDNAALTYLASLVEGLDEFSRYAIVAGAVVGGGLTVIANAPNPIAFGILQKHFGDEGISPAMLLLNALVPTLIAGILFWI